MTVAATVLGAHLASFAGATPAAAHVHQQLDEVEVFAPRQIERERLPLGRGERVSLTYSVRAADLDLSQAADRRQLEQRLTEAAEEICERLRRMDPISAASTRPVGDHATRSCVRRAVADALVRVEGMMQAEGTMLVAAVADTNR